MIVFSLYVFINYLRSGGASPPCACLRQRDASPAREMTFAKNKQALFRVGVDAFVV